MQENQMLMQRSDYLYNTIAHYIDFKGDADKFAKHLEKKVKENQKEQSNVEGNITKNTK